MALHFCLNTSGDGILTTLCTVYYSGTCALELNGLGLTSTLLLTHWLFFFFFFSFFGSFCNFSEGFHPKWSYSSYLVRASLIAQLVKNPPAMQETPVQFLGQEDPLEKG